MHYKWVSSCYNFLIVLYLYFLKTCQADSVSRPNTRIASFKKTVNTELEYNIETLLRNNTDLYVQCSYAEITKYQLCKIYLDCGKV